MQNPNVNGDADSKSQVSCMLLQQ